MKIWNATRRWLAAPFAVLLFAPSLVLAVDCTYSEMSVDPDSTTPVDCYLSTIANIDTSPTGLEEPITFLEDLGYTDVVYLGKEEEGATEGSPALTLTFDNGDWTSTTGDWTSTITLADGTVLIAALKFDAVPVEFHDLGTVALNDTGLWETDEGCTLASAPDACTGNWDLSNIVYFTATSPVPIPAAAWLFGTAMLGMVGIGRRRRQQA